MQKKIDDDNGEENVQKIDTAQSALFEEVKMRNIFLAGPRFDRHLLAACCLHGRLDVTAQITHFL